MSQYLLHIQNGRVVFDNPTAIARTARRCGLNQSRRASLPFY